MPISPRLSRRTLLRGIGATVALPWLDAMAGVTARGAELVRPPVRIGFFYVPNGVNMGDWRPGPPGDLAELPKTLKSLEPVKDKILVLSDLAAEHCASKEAGHEPAGGGYLIGYKCKHSEVPEVGGTSVDQVAAREIGLKTPVDSLALGIDPGIRGDHGFSGTYMSHISWRGKTTPSPLELNPKELYDRLFRGRALSQPDWNAPAAPPAPKADSAEANVLDLVRDDAKALQRQLGYNDRRKLEDYLDGLRSIEKRITLASRDDHSHHQDAFANAPEAQSEDPRIPKLVIPNGKGIPSIYSEHVNLILDMLVLAFQTDTTRIASFMFSYEKSGRSYPDAGIRASHHSTSHHGKDKEKLDILTQINSHHMELFSRMLQKMSQIDEGGSTLLDNVMFSYGSGISDGNKHNHDDLPVIVAGGGGGTLRGGRHIAYGQTTPLCNLYLEMLQRVGAPRDSFGDSTGLLGNLGG